jgi:hypothetical protein
MSDQYSAPQMLIRTSRWLSRKHQAPWHPVRPGRYQVDCPHTSCCGVHALSCTNRHHVAFAAPEIVQLVLYGIFPAALLGAAITALWSRWRLRPASRFKGHDLATARQMKLYKFKSPGTLCFVCLRLHVFTSAFLGRSGAERQGGPVVTCSRMHARAYCCVNSGAQGGKVGCALYGMVLQ